MYPRAFLLILDGWGIGEVPEADAILQAQTPFFDSLMTEFPNSRLVTHGMDVGLPVGQMGNSEVGHLNLGAGRVVYQDFTRIEKAIAEGQLSQHQALLNLAAYCKQKNRACHLIGLVSDGGVHSHIRHLEALVETLESMGVERIYIHAITDGRDTDPHSGGNFIRRLEQFLEGRKTKIASLIGRYFAMDRDQRWERIQKAYDLMVKGTGLQFENASNAIDDSYAKGITDEFMEPCKIGDSGAGCILENDAVLCFNFRTDRLRQLTRVLTQEAQGMMKPMHLYYLTMTRYDAKFQNIHVIFENQDLSNTLGESLSRYGLSQLRIAETEKYPHVSFFFSGGREKPFSGERRILIPSPKVATYDLQPEMSAKLVMEAVLKEMEQQSSDFICLNFANADMVGHTGVFDAVKRAAETVDQCLQQIIPCGLEKNYVFIILADHGNGDYMINEDGSPNTAHSMNPVPCILVGRNLSWTLKDGKLADIAPTILQLLSLPVPAEMDGQSLLTELNAK